MHDEASEILERADDIIDVALLCAADHTIQENPEWGKPSEITDEQRLRIREICIFILARRVSELELHILKTETPYLYCKALKNQKRNHLRLVKDEIQ